MTKGMSNTVKRICVSVLIAMLLITMLPFTSSDYEAFAASRGTFHYGSVVKDANGKSYSWGSSMMAPAYWWDAGGNRVTDSAATYESASAGMEYYTIKTGGKTIKGYCVAHGIRVDTTTNLTGKSSLESWAHTGAYPLSSRRGIEHALLYGYQDGRTISQLKKSGFEDSKWYGKHAKNGYTNGDWYMATQILIWEYQQLIRTDSIDGGHGRQDNGLVKANHYYNVVKGRAAEDIYNYMAYCIKNHRTVASFAWKEKADCEEKSKGWLMKKDPDTGYYTATLTDNKKIEGLVASGTSKDKWTIKQDGNKYTFTYKGKNLPEDGIVFKFTKKNYLQDELKNSGMLIWSWSSAGSLRQAVATGVKDDPVPMYIKFYAKDGDDDDDDPDPEKRPKPEPEFFPTFEFPVDKEDLNPGWDGDVHTGMGDASLAATYTLYRSINDGDWEAVDSVTLDEYGNQQILKDQPWITVSDLIQTDSGSYTHVEDDSTHCVVQPTKTEWTGNVKYKVVETRPDGRFIEPDSGIRDTYEADYYAVTNNSQTCTSNPENWSDIEYTLKYSDDSGTNENLTGKMGENGIEENGIYSFSEETFVNDCDRGRLFLSKSNESEDVFNEEGSSGAQNKSKNSKWKMYLNSEGWEEHPYISFVDEGYSDEGTHYYRVVRDTTGTDNATTDMTVGTNGCIYIYDIPYGTYTVEEVAADDTSFVLESFEQFIDENTAEHNGAMSGGDSSNYAPNDSKNYDNRYDWNLRDKKKENVIKVVKTDAETGKPVDLKGTKFYIRYMGNQLLADPTKSENYGRLLPNASDINSTSKDYTFTCNENGEIVLPYDLEFGTYRLEEFLLPDGYFVGIYDKDGNVSNANFGTSGEYGKDDNGTAKPGKGWDSIHDNDPANDVVAVYDKDGKHVDYKAGDVFNFYTFKVEKQENHKDGEEYKKYYKAVAMPNNPVKGKIEVSKTGEVLAGFEKTEKDGYTVWTPKYVLEKLKDAVFGVYAAVDEWLNDGNDGSQIYDAATGEEIKIPTDKSTHSGDNSDGAIYDEGAITLESGAKLYYKKERDVSEDDHYTRVYTSPEQKDSTYSYSFEKLEDGLKYRYDVNVAMRYDAGGSNYTDITVDKVTSVADGYAVHIPTTDATSIVGGQSYSPAINVGDADGNVFDINKITNVYEINGEKVYDTDGNLQVDLSDIGVKRYTVKDYQFYKLTAADLVKEERIVEEGIDLDGDGKYDKDGEKEPVKETKTKYEWDNDVTLVKPAEGGKAVIKVTDDTYAVAITGYMEDAKLVEKEAFIASDETGAPAAQYTVPDGWTEIPYLPQISVDEGETVIDNPHYALIMKVEDGVTSYKVLLDDAKTWQDCDSDTNFAKMVTEEYKASYTQDANSDSGFTFELDGIVISSQAIKADKTATTVITSPFDVTPTVELGIGYSKNIDGNTTTITATEPSAPVYFMTSNGIRTEMYYFGNKTKTLLTIPMNAVEGNYENVVPGIKFTRTGEIIDWYSQLTPDNPVFKREAAYGNTVTATRHEGGKDSDVYYTVEIISDQTMNEGDGPFEITYQDRYTAKIYAAKSEAGNGIGVMVIDGVYKTNRAALSDLVEIITTGEDGVATTSELPLGKYIIRELSAPEGYVADTEKSWTVDLKYKDQFTPLVWEKISSSNKYVTVELDMSKVFETGYNTDKYVAGGGAVFGLYNAAPITYGKDTLAADTLIDTLKVDDNGKALTETKIPEGIYYLKELKTRNGYVLNDTPFYFVAGDSIKSAPLDISKDADGQDFDGVTAKAVMDGYGRAIITIETLTQKPAAKMTINGKEYVLDQAYPTEDDKTAENVTVKIHKDMSRTKVVVTEDSPAEITLANGKTLRLAVTGNTYTYIYDGQEGTYIPTVMNTGYYADYTLEEKQADPKNPADHTLTLTAAEGSSTVTAETVHERIQKLKDGTGIDLNGDGLYDQEGEVAPVYEDVLDKDGNPTFNLYADVKLTTGTLTAAMKGKESLDLAELGDNAIRIKKGETLKLTADDGAVYILNMDKNGNLKASVANTMTCEMTDENAPVLAIDGKAVTEGFETHKSITTARQDSSVSTVQVKINTLDNLNAGDIENDADKTPDIPDIPDIPGPGPSTPSIRTTAKDSETGDHIARADGKVTIIDTVSYTGLTPGQEYTLKGVLMDKDTGKAITAGGKEVTAEKVFTPEKASGTVDMEFNFDGSALEGKTTVVFESLYKNIDTDGDKKPDTPADKPTAEHKDINDEGQSIYFPEIKTNAADYDTKDHIANADKKVTIIDKVTYENLIPGKEYTVSGTLMDKSTGKALLVDGEKVTATKTFTPTEPDGSVELTFTLDASELAGKTTVVFETLKYEGKTVAVHRDIKDKEQTVRFPEVKTTAAQTAKGQITDIVEYKNLIPGKKYTVTGVLMDKDTGKEIKVDGKPVTASRTFTPEKADGKVKVTFTFEPGSLQGKTVVVFETLLLGSADDGKIVGEHKDLNDKNQTIKKVGTVDLDYPDNPGNGDDGNVGLYPQTGDSSNVMLYIGLMIAALALITLLVAYRRRQMNSQEKK